MIIQGKVGCVLGDNISTDEISASGNLKDFSLEQLGQNALRAVEPEFYQKIQQGHILAVGSNFGCGSSREWAAVAIKAAGVEVIIAKSFARIFFRNAINIGMPLIECGEALAQIKEGDQLRVDLASGRVEDLTRSLGLQGSVLPEFLLEILQRGGLIT